jgi:signal transduction histidine kinase
LQIVRQYEKMERVALNPGQMVQVVGNLLQNAWEAMPDGGILLLSVQTQLADGVVEIAIEDTGPGIPAEILPHVFEPFFTTKSTEGRRGLGLAISLAMTERHGGTLKLETPIRRSGGTRAIVRLPINSIGGTHV